MKSLCGRSIYYLAFDVDLADLDLCKSAMGHFVEHMSQIVPDYASQVEAAPEWLQAFIGREIEKGSNIPQIAADLEFCLLDHDVSGSKLLILCRARHALALLSKQANPAALWGGAVQGSSLALLYGQYSRFGVWHELLHLYGAEDCYALPDQGPTCDESRCIMQYVPTGATAGPGLVLCAKNLNRIRYGYQALRKTPGRESI